MKTFILHLLLTGIFFMSLVACEGKLDKDFAVCYSAPAKDWKESLPLGNEYWGALWQGNIMQEDIFFNDKELCGRKKQDNSAGKSYSIAELRRLVQEGEKEKVCDILENYLIGGRYTPDTFPLIGNLHLKYGFAEGDPSVYTDYERGFSLGDAVAWTCFRVGNVKYKREYFISSTDDILVIRLSASRKGKLNFDVSLQRPEFASCYSNDGVVFMEGNLLDADTGRVANYRAQLRVFQENGIQVADSAEIHVTGADSAYILLASVTDLRYKDFEQKLESLTASAASMEMPLLRARHSAVWQEQIREDGIAL